MSFLIIPLFLIFFQKDGMNPDDRIHLENLRTLERSFQTNSTDWAVAVELVETLHALRRDKPVLEICELVPTAVILIVAGSGFLYLPGKGRGQ